MNRRQRILVVTLGLIGAGAVFGAVAGGVAVTIAAVLTGGPTLDVDPAFFEFGAYVGAPIGAISLPIVAWILLRRIPLGRAIGWSVIGTVAGGVIGFTVLIRTNADAFVGGLVSAFLGFLAAAVAMWLGPRLRVVGQRPVAPRG
jgi:hypothetical protein